METITLKNGKQIELQWSFLTMQYLEDYDGGLKKLEKDVKARKNLLRIQSLFIYAAVRSNYDETVGYQEAIRLVHVKDVKKINDFFTKNLNEQNEFKKKQRKCIQQKKYQKR